MNVVAGWRFDNSYARLPRPLFSPAVPAAVRRPATLVFNAALAGELGLEFTSAATAYAKFSAAAKGSALEGDGARKVFEAVAKASTVMSLSADESNGVFRARRSDGSLDPAGFVKGWAAERAGHALAAHGLRSWYLNVGGDIRTSGTQASGEQWRIGVVDPGDRTAIAAWFDIPENFAVATSGTAARGAHVWDGRDGSAVSQPGSFTVIGPHLMWADAFATVCFALGDAARDWLARYPDYSGFPLT